MSNILNKQQELAKTAFGELSVASLTPLVQVTAQYGLLDDVLGIALGGSVTTQDSNFVASTGAGPNNVAAIVSSREAQYKAGQGLMARFTAIFTQGQANSTQQAGLITSESAFAFGYNGSEYGILHARDGQLENQELTVTTSATSAETATVVVDGVGYPVNLSNGTTQDNAFEIATELESTVPGYNFTSVGDVVYCLAQLPDFGSGVFAFTSATAVASWVQIKNGVIPTETWIPKVNWNLYPDIDIDPALGNVYQIQIQYLGYGAITFSVEDPDNGELVPVHIIKYSNSAIVPSVSNPIFRVGWAARNTGNTSDIVVKGASAAAFVEGAVVYDGLPKGICQTQLGVNTTRTNILSIRNRLTFNGTANRAEIIPIAASFATDTTKTAFFELLRDPVYADPVTFERYSANSLMELSKDSVEVSGGEVVDCFTVKSATSIQVDINKVLEQMIPGETYSIAASVSSGSASDMDATFAFKEDL
ncbi:MAG: hypothetical protein ACPGUE_12080 [Marinomonas sp.]